MKTFIEHGEVWEIPAPTGGAKSGDLIVQGIAFGIAAHDAAEGDPLRVRPGGVHEKAAATGQAWTHGLAIYWDATAKNFTSTVGSNLKVGYAFTAKASAAAVGRVKLNTSF
ncbi:DUF2190 family protein [Roseomonas populi]|uniref:DUF2190 family protein n=1 Tax=Roseomonas populi TaxID=3121582 RepID=A0ABT1X1X6_9PROT|nr:DUF2190 family protein [Roseomonas pecuniae]MCR0981796.1 DUF2190 family protein [Roseomonas pecuniae]